MTHVTFTRAALAAGLSLALTASLAGPLAASAFAEGETPAGDAGATATETAAGEPTTGGEGGSSSTIEQTASIKSAKGLLYKGSSYKSINGKKQSKAVCGMQVALATTEGLGGTITYKFTTAKKTYTGTCKANKTAKKAGNKKQKGRYFTVKLSGDVAEKYDVYYRAYAKGYYWLGWVKNGSKAGTANLDLIGYQVKLVKKDAASKPSTDRAGYSAKTGFASKITGNATVDKKIKSVVKSCGYDLSKCAQWAVKQAYASTGRSEVTSGAIGSSRILTEAKAAFKSTSAAKNSGDCYTHTVAFYCLAKHLGYTAKAVSGTYTNDKGNSQPYSWVTVKTGGELHIWDTLNPTHSDGTSRLDIAPDSPLYGYFS